MYKQQKIGSYYNDSYEPEAINPGIYSKSSIWYQPIICSCTLIFESTLITHNEQNQLIDQLSTETPQKRNVVVADDYRHTHFNCYTNFGEFENERKTTNNETNNKRDR